MYRRVFCCLLQSKRGRVLKVVGSGVMVLDEERMRPGHLLVVVYFSALALLIAIVE